MSYGKAIRQWAENLILGASGTTHLIATGRFHLRAADGRLEDHPFDASERAIEIVVRGGSTLPGYAVNLLDGKKIQRHTMLVRISYALTNAGGDGVESVTEQDGSGTIDAIRDRATTDLQDIADVLSHTENWVGVSPEIISCLPVEDTEPDDLRTTTDEAIIEGRFFVHVWATIPATSPPSSYAP